MNGPREDDTIVLERVKKEIIKQIHIVFKNPDLEDWWLTFHLEERIKYKDFIRDVFLFEQSGACGQKADWLHYSLGSDRH